MVIPAEYVSSICEVKTMDNVLVATGMIDEIAEDYMEISVKSGKMVGTSFGAEVKINIFNSKMGFRVLAGKVYTSSRDFIRVVEVISILDYERRHFFRVDMDLRAQICVRRDETVEELEKLERLEKEALQAETEAEMPEKSTKPPLVYSDYPVDGDEEAASFLKKYALLPIRVKNLSISGVLFSSNCLFESEYVWIKMRIERFNGPYLCTIKRVQEGAIGQYLYGCEFVDMADDVSNALCRFIFQKQREQINIKTRAI